MVKRKSIVFQKYSNNHIIKLDSDNLRIFKSMLQITLFVGLGKLAGAAKEIVVAAHYGIGPEIDSYLFVFNILIWPASVWFSVISFILIPLVIRLRHDNPNILSRFRAELLGLTLLFGIVLTLIAWFGLPVLIRSSWSGLTPEAQKIALNSVFILAPISGLFVVIGLLSAWMLSAGHHLNTLFEGIPALCILLTILVMPKLGFEALLWGTVIGFVLHLLALALPLARSNELGVPRIPTFVYPWSEFGFGFGLLLIGQILSTITGIIDQFFITHNLVEGSIATLGYTQKILGLLLGLIATAVSRATLPVFSKLQAQNTPATKRSVFKWAILLFVIGCVVIFFSYLFAPLIVKLFFERGAFTSIDTTKVTSVLRYGLFQLPFYIEVILFGSFLICRKRYGMIAIVGGISVITKILANIFLIPKMGVNGVMLGTVIMYAIIAVYYFILVINSPLKINETGSKI